MSSNTNFTCRETYYSYGSYLRSRGYDKEICNLVAAIEAGQIKIGPITPGSCSNNNINPTTINNSVTINGCPSGHNSTTGILKVTGGNNGPTNVDPSGTITTFLSGSTNYGIQSNTGIRNLGPIYSSTDCNHSNYFGAANHIFAGGSGGDCSANVIVRGNLLVDGSFVELGSFFGETLTLVTLPANTALGTLNLFRSPQANGNTMTVYNDTSDNILSGGWETGLTFSIDGNLENTTPGSGIDRIAGMTDTHGHVRSFRGITVSNPPLDGQPIDICYNRDISGSPYALQVYGNLTIDRGNNDASGNIDLSGGDINFYLNNNKNAYIHSNGDASFNGHVTIYDLSVINVMTVGTSTTYIDTNDVSTNNLKANNVNAGFVIVDNSLNTSFIYSPMVEDLTIQAGTSGTANVEFVANKVIINDLSVNDICANSINLNVAIFNNITTTDLSVNNHASIFDLSVTNLLNVGDVTITQSQVQTNTLRSTNTNPLTIQGGLGGQNIILQAGTVNMRDNVSLVTISDLSVNDISAGQIDVTNIDVSMITNSGKITTTDLSVNTHASIFDLSVINLMTVGNDISLTNGTVTSTLVDCSNISVSNNGRFINDVSVNNILEVGLNTITYDLSVNRHASIYDLSVVNFMTIGTSTTTIDTNSINATSGYFNDISVNDLSVNSLKVESLEIASQLILQDLSVNNSASFNDVSINTLQVDNIASVSNNLTVGNKIIVQDLSVNGLASIFDLSVINLMTVGTSTTTIDTNSINAISGIFDNSLNVNDNFSVNHSTGIIDFSATKVEFNNGLIIEKSSTINTINTIRAPFNQSQQIKISTGTGGSDGSGSMIIESGKQLDLTSVGFTTITASGQGQGIDLSANGNITLTATDVSFIDVSNVYFGNSIVDISDLRIGYRISTDNIVSPNDELKISSLQGMTFLSSGGDININGGNNDISFNADTITFDASVCFLKDPSIKEEIYENRELKIYGSSTIIFDISGPYKSGTGGTVPPNMTTDLSFVKCIYKDFKPTSLFNNIFTENYIDFSNNQTAVTNFLFEVYLSISAKFTNQTEALTFQFIDVDSSTNVVDIDTRSISPKAGNSTVVFGPVSFVFKSGVYPDYSLITKQWKIAVDQLGTGATIDSDPRLTIKMKSIA